MDAPDIAVITKIVKMVGTEFKTMSDEDISFWIGLQAPVISQKNLERTIIWLWRFWCVML